MCIAGRRSSIIQLLLTGPGEAARPRWSGGLHTNWRNLLRASSKSERPDQADQCTLRGQPVRRRGVAGNSVVVGLMGIDVAFLADVRSWPAIILCFGPAHSLEGLWLAIAVVGFSETTTHSSYV